MPSIRPGYEYDIFISYRHNDNRSGWVTEFVTALREELSATIKEPLSVYFDSNPYDGLLETHHVGKSLEHKLRSLILIPVLSQTYCDENSFAWRHEFCVFNRLAKEDALGRDVKLSNGNVTSRILPVKIHDIDLQDKTTFENEIGAALRGIDFTYREPGVNRPLKPNDSRADNQNKNDYRNQLNKVANTVKDIIYAINYPDRRSESSTEKSAQPVADAPLANEKSLAVLPFANLSQDANQDYFADGIAENILTQLCELQNVRVISRTSVMKFKKTSLSAPEIARELAIHYIVQGTVQTHKEKVRISVQLIDALEDRQLWSQKFVENMDDIFSIQDNVASAVREQLHASLAPAQGKKSNAAPTKDLEAYDLFLKGRHAYNQWTVIGYRTASEYFAKAIDRDPEFRDAYSYLASAYCARMSWNGDLSPDEALKNLEPFLNEAWRRGPSDNDYLTKGFIEFFVRKDLALAEKLISKAIEMNANNSLALFTLSYVLNLSGRWEEAAAIIDKAKKIEPLSVAYFNHHALNLYLQRRFAACVEVLREALQLFPSVLRFYDFLGRAFVAMEHWEDAKIIITTGFNTSGTRPPSMVAFLSIAASRLGELATRESLIRELENRSSAGEKGVNIYLVYANLLNSPMAKHWLARSRASNDVDLIWFDTDPLMQNLRSELERQSTPDFDSAEAHITAWLEREMPRLSYHNVEHVKDVLQAAMKIAENEGVDDEGVRMIRIAALLHDVGFMRSAKDHERMGADMASELLPSFDFDSGRIDVIRKMILATRLPQSPATQLERVLCDADLDYLGRDDFFETGGKLFTEMKEHGIVENEREWNLVQRTFLQSHKYHTEFSRINREPRKQERLQDIMLTLAKRTT